MKKIIFGLFLLLFIIPTSVQASGVFDFVSLVMPNGEEKTGFWPSQNDSKKSEIASFSATPLSSGARNDVPCDFGSRYDYRRDKCEKVFVPEYGRLNSDGISVSCEMGYILKYGKVQDSGLAGMTIDKCIKVVVPAHAQLSGTGDDFQCDRDFKRVEERCEKLILPANSHIAAGGNDFDCNTGYSKQDGKCVDARKPANAKFFPQSDDWYCENGYEIAALSAVLPLRERNDGLGECEALKVPSNGRVSETGTFFYCLSGHKLASNGKDCEQISVPENAKPNWIGSWKCDVGYRKIDDLCEKVENVEHGMLLSDSGFYCEAHFKRDETDRKCVEILLPQNASWDEASSDIWRCNQGYVKNDDRCEVFTLPEHAFWVGFNSWDCDSGYVKNYRELKCDRI